MVSATSNIIRQAIEIVKSTNMYPSNEAGMVSATQIFLLSEHGRYMYPSNEAGMVSATFIVFLKGKQWIICIHPMKPEWCLQQNVMRQKLERLYPSNEAGMVSATY